MKTEQKPIIVDYINWNGKQALRKVIPTGVYWGSTKFHGEPQWLLTAICCRSGDEKTFALGDCNFDVFRHHNVYFEEDTSNE